MIVDAVTEYMEADGIGVIGKTLFVGEMPLNVGACVSAVPSPSPEPDKAIPYFVQEVDVWARNPKAGDCYQKLQDVFDLFHRAHHYTMGSYYVYLSYALGGIDDLDRDVERRKLCKVSLAFIYRAA